jgi:hypothetical protein
MEKLGFRFLGQAQEGSGKRNYCVLICEQSTSFTLTDQSEWKEGAEITSRKTETKVSVDKYDTKSHWTFANDKFALKVERDDIVEGDLHLDGDLAFELKPAKDEWKVTATAHAHTKDFSGFRAFVNVSKAFQNPRALARERNDLTRFNFTEPS